MLSTELLAKIRKLQYRAGHLVTEALSGEYSSAFKGQGMEFDEVREYVPGDDIRAIDWNVTARMNQPFVKIFREERELTLMLMVDVSPSQEFGSGGRSKREVTAELAAVLAFLAIRNNDKVGLIAFSDHVEKYIPPKKGRGHVWNIIKEILGHKGKGKGTNISGALDYMNSVCKRKSMCFLLSDFRANHFLKPLQSLRKRHDLVCINIYDPIEKQIPDAGLIEVEDAESGRRIIVDAGSASFRSELERYETARFQNLEKDWRQRRIDYFHVATSDDTIKPLEQFMRRRERRRYR